MSYKTYTTEAIVCGSRANNTSDKSFLLFTREAGMLWASAKSVREERSRQRFALQDFSLIRVSLVKGKSGWRVGSAESEINYFAQAATKEARHQVAAVIRLVKQFVRGEEAQTELFDDVKTALGLSVKEEADANILPVFSLRFLNHLGYIASPQRFTEYLQTSKWWGLPPLPPSAHAAIAKAKDASHL